MTASASKPTVAASGPGAAWSEGADPGETDVAAADGGRDGVSSVEALGDGDGVTVAEGDTRSAVGDGRMVGDAVTEAVG
jgi:hypothetical protein